MTAFDNLYACLREGFGRRLDEPFLRLVDGTFVTYDEIDDLSARVAGALRRRGLVAGDRLVAQVGKSPLTVALYLGCLRVGVVYVPLNEGYTDLEVDYFVGDARPRMVVSAPSRNVPHGGAEVLTLDEQGGGTLADLVAGDAAGPGSRASSGTDRGDALHVGHDRQAQGRDAHHREPDQQRCLAGRAVGVPS